jgi:hypothetical protein
MARSRVTVPLTETLPGARLVLGQADGAGYTGTEVAAQIQLSGTPTRIGADAAGNTPGAAEPKSPVPGSDDATARIHEGTEW